MCTHEYTSGVQEIGTRDLRANLAAVVRQAGSGERVIVTLDGRPVAQLGPIAATAAPTLAELAAAGLVEPPRRHDRLPAPDAVVTAVDVRLDRVLAEVRGE